MILNSDETYLFWQCLVDYGFILKSELHDLDYPDDFRKNRQERLEVVRKLRRFVCDLTTVEISETSDLF